MQPFWVEQVIRAKIQSPRDVAPCCGTRCRHPCKINFHFLDIDYSGFMPFAREFVRVKICVYLMRGKKIEKLH